jgi:hypothetical protein
MAHVVLYVCLREVVRAVHASLHASADEGGGEEKVGQLSHSGGGQVDREVVV